jgi:predicted HAD superfamily phosphohydrolase YqeG
VTPALLRTTLSSVLVLFMLASAHLLMVVVNAVEARVAAPQPSAGLTARMYTDRPLVEELESALRKEQAPANQLVLQRAVDQARAGREVTLHTLPVTPFLVQATLALTLAGLVLMWTTSRLKSDAAQTIVGVFAGNLIWTGSVEYGLTLPLAPSVSPRRSRSRTGR